MKRIASVCTVLIFAACSSDRSTAPAPTDRALPATANRVSLVTPSDTGFWTTKAPMPTSRYGIGVGVVNDILYAVGGYSVDYLSNNQAYNPVTNTWTAKPAIPTPRFDLGVGVIDGVLYAVGGQSASDVSPVVEAYTPATNAWTTKASMPTARLELGVGVVNGVLYAIGGYNNGFSTTVEAYNPTTDMWTIKASMPTPRAGFGVGVVNGVIYVIGGYNTHLLATVEAYDPATNTWTTKTPMPVGRRSFAVGVIENVLYAVGGQDSASLATTVEAYEPVADKWTTEAAMPTLRSSLGAGVVHDMLYAVGGQSGQTSVGTVEAFTPPQASAPQFDFTGFFLPLHNPPAVNRVRAGSVVPVKFSLHGNQGLNIFAPGYPQSQRQTCNGRLMGIPTRTRTAGSIRLVYAKRTDQYVYAWKTEKSWAGTCRTLSLQLTDGSTHQALFFFEGKFPY